MIHFNVEPFILTQFVKSPILVVSLCILPEGFSLDDPASIELRLKLIVSRFIKGESVSSETVGPLNDQQNLKNHLGLWH